MVLPVFVSKPDCTINENVLIVVTEHSNVKVPTHVHVTIPK